jgi:hypothetical protein
MSDQPKIEPFAYGPEADVTPRERFAALGRVLAHAKSPSVLLADPPYLTQTLFVAYSGSFCCGSISYRLADHA